MIIFRRGILNGQMNMIKYHFDRKQIVTAESKAYIQTHFEAAHDETKEHNIDREKGGADVSLKNKGIPCSGAHNNRRGHVSRSQYPMIKSHAL